jgi:hypothetical protein
MDGRNFQKRHVVGLWALFYWRWFVCAAFHFVVIAVWVGSGCVRLVINATLHDQKKHDPEGSRCRTLAFALSSMFWFRNDQRARSQIWIQLRKFIQIEMRSEWWIFYQLNVWKAALMLELIHSQLSAKVNIPICYTFFYRRRSGFFSALSPLTNQLMPEKTRTSPIEKRIQFVARNVEVVWNGALKTGEWILVHS